MGWPRRWKCRRGFFVRARHERQRVAAAGRRRDAAVVSALPSRVRSRCGVARSGRRIEAAARTGLRANGVGIRHPASGIRLARFRRCAADCRLSRETLSRRLAALRPCVPIAARDGRRCRGEAQSQRSLGAIGTPSAPERDACGTTRHTLDSRNGPEAPIASPVRSGRTRIAAIAGECVCGNPTCANRCLGTASGEKRQVSRDQNSAVERADHARGRAHAVCATASRAASDAASRKRGMNASARGAGAHRGTPRPPRPRAARCGASRRPPVGFVGAPKRPFAALVRTCRICASVCRNSSAARGFSGNHVGTL